MKRTTLVMIKKSGKAILVNAMVCKPVLEQNPITKQNVLCGYIRRNGKHIRVHQVTTKSGTYWVSTWDFPG